jgi:hypothetical protein
MSFTSLKDVLRTFAQSLQISTSFPAMVFVLVNVLVVFPKIWPDVDWTFANEMVTILTILVVMVLSYTLYTFNTPLIRIAEGYWTEDIGWLKSFKEYLRQYQLAEYNRLFATSSPTGEGRNAAQALDIYFPSNPDDVMATPLGNTIAAFEDYPYTRYGMDAIALWPRLVPILRETEYLEFVAEQKAHFDFMLNITLVVLVCGAELIYLMTYLGYLVGTFLLLVLTPLLVWLFYLGTVNGAVEWGLSVRVAFDLHRDELWKRLRLQPASSYRQEFARWRRISEFILYGSEKLDFKEFSYEEETSQV